MTKKNSPILMSELVLSVNEPDGEESEELIVLAKHTCWFLRAADENDAIHVHSTNTKSAINKKHLVNLDSRQFGPAPEMNCRETPTVLLLGSSLNELNGLYEVEQDNGCPFSVPTQLFEKRKR